MRFRGLAPMLVAILLAGCSRNDAQPPHTQPASATQPANEHDFISAHVAAINSKSVDRLRSLRHPVCLARITGENQHFFDEMDNRQLQYSIPSDYTSSSQPLEPAATLPFEDAFNWPVRPTATVQIDFNAPTGDRDSTHLLRWVVVEKGRCLEVIPIPTADTLAKARKAKADEASRKTRVAELAGKLSDPLLSEIKGLFGQGRRVEAFKRYSEATGEPLAMARDVVYLVAARTAATRPVSDSRPH